jgi:predicted acyltransferase
MILVNYAGNGDFVFAPLQHSEWWGISFTDLIAPFFLFTVGISIALAYTKRLDAGSKPGEMYNKLFLRAFKIFALGMILNLIGILDNFSWEQIRWTGTLHRIAIVFLVCGLMFLKTSWRTQAVIGSVVLVLYWLVMVFIPTPGYGKPMLEPGINLAAWVDHQWLPGRMWEGDWDPEGILSTFPAIVTGITGMLAGTLLLSKRTLENKVNLLFFCGFVSFVIGIVWNWSFGLNENLWSPSFVMLTSGMASLTLASCIYLIDIHNYRKLAQFGVIYGMNAIAVYVLADLLTIIFYGLPVGGNTFNTHFFNAFTAIGFAPKVASMLYALIYVGVCFIPALLLYRKKIFIKL